MPDLDESSRPPLLVDALRWRATHKGDEEAYTFLLDGETEEESLTYAELDRRARAIGARLQSLGEVGERVLLLCPAGLDYVAGFFGCLYAGFVAVPAYAPNPPQQVETLRSVVHSSQPLIGITTRAALPDILKAFAQDPELARLSWLCVDEMPAGSEREWREPDIGLDDLMYLVYTSGSTSVPKGVMLAYRSFPPAFLREQYHARGCENRFVNWAAPNTGGGISWGIIEGVSEGIPVTSMAPEAFYERPARWIAAISRTRATHSLAPNFAYDLVLDTVPPEERGKYDLSSWQFAYNGGEQVRPETIERFEDAFAASGLRHGTVISGYGLTEARGLATAWPGKRPTILTFDRAKLQEGLVVLLDEHDKRGLRLVAQGVPNDGVDLLIADPATARMVEPNRVGEIWVRGTHISMGYWNDPEATRDAFQAHLADSGKGPYFRTGDLGFLYGGELFLPGRKKEMIIIRGRNIYPLDVELAAQKSHPALQNRAGAAFAIEEGGEERLIVVQEVGEEVDLFAVAAAIRRTVAAEIGVQAHTVALVPPGSIPRTPTGKIRHAACREVFLSAELPLLLADVRGDMTAERRNPYVAPVTPLEKQMAGIWERVLGVSPIGTQDDFLDLGGDSLRSLQVLARMRERGIHATMEQTRRYGTVAALAEAITNQPAAIPEEEPVVGPVPLLLMHYGVLANREQPPDDVVLIQSFATTQRLDPEVLDRAAKQVIFHHDALRLQFTFTSDGWEAKCVAHIPNRIVSFTDLSELPAEDRQACIVAEYERLRGQIDVRIGPMIQIGLLHLGSDAPDRLVIALPHLVFDGVCLPILLSDLETAYIQLQAGQTVRLPAKTTSIRRWGEKIREMAASDELREEILYWLEVLASQPAVVPQDIAAYGGAGGQIRSLWSALDAEPTQQLLRVSPHRNEFQIGDAFHYAVARAIAERTGSHSVLIDMLGHGREPLAPDIDVSRTLGYFTTLFPIRLDLDPGAGPLEAVAGLRQQLERVPRHGIGFDILRYLGRDPLCAGLRVRDRPVRVNYTGIFDETFGGLTLLQPERAAATHFSWPAPRTDLLTIRGSIADGTLDVRIDYHDRVYAGATAAQLAADICEHLEEVAEASRSCTLQMPL